MKRIFCLLFLVSGFVTAALAEPVPGDSCTAYPEHSVMRSGGPELNGKIYVMRCQGGIWVAAPINEDPCSLADADIGTACLDGTLYAGLSPDGGGKMYVDVTEESLKKWASVSTAVQEENCSGSYLASNCTTGRANTALLAGLGEGYAAATYCTNLNTAGHADWYLPALHELRLLYELHLNGLGDFHGDTTAYLSSSEAGTTARGIRFSDGAVRGLTKTGGFYTRCVRQN